MEGWNVSEVYVCDMGGVLRCVGGSWEFRENILLLEHEKNGRLQSVSYGG